jgi:hypothetical protein
MPKSSGRRKTAKPKAVRRTRSPSSPPATQLLDQAALIGGFENALHAEIWASSKLGIAWTKAGLGEKEPEHQLCMHVINQARATPTLHGLLALVALSRVAPATAVAPLSKAVNVLSKNELLPSWCSDTVWTPRAAWRAVDVYDSARMLLIDYDEPEPHTLMAGLYQVGGLEVRAITILSPNAAEDWEEIRPPGEVPMPLASCCPSS